MAFTYEQQLAIDTHGTNIVVSAGAGSGKTAVLTERIFKMIEGGQDISRLLVLTFTRAAALEMKERIKKRIIQSGKYTEQLDKIDSAFITTFDSFSLSVVKKYHYLLNVDKNVAIIDGGVIALKKSEILDRVFDQYYYEDNETFFLMLEEFTKKNDKTLRKFVLSITKGLEQVIDKEKYLDNYLIDKYSDNALDEKVNLYLETVKRRMKDMLLSLNELYDLMAGTKFGSAVLELIHFIENAQNYGEIRSFFNTFKFPILRGADEVTKELKERFKKDEYDAFKNTYLEFSNEDEIKESLLATKKYLVVILDILRKYFDKVSEYKKQNSLFEFNDIAMMSLDLLKKYPDVRQELADSFDEILVDEYQDTSDIQETFINLIGKNNIYMVGDIKQSIYRFRNANPYIFKNKYDHYKHQDGGIKIDLSKNFRSRKDVLNNINLIFSSLMNDLYGDANYQEEHQMNYGNTDYDKYYSNGFDYDMEFLMYQPDEEKIYKNDEIEIFLVAEKIKELIDSKMMIYDKDLKGNRKIKYSDIAIILDRGKLYPLYSKIFTYLGIPLDVISNEKISDHILLHIIASIFNLIRLVDSNDEMYSYYFMSVARSFLLTISDNQLLAYSFDNYKNNELSLLAKDIKNYAYTHSPIMTFEYILKRFDVYEKLVLIGDVNNSLAIITHIAGLVENLSGAGYTFDDIALYFEETLNKDVEIKASNKASGAGVKILNIHQSKGLEYPICFFAGLYADFNLGELKDSFLFEKNFGIITPYFTDRKCDTIDKILLKEDYIKKEISEKIRLFYVALTRAREKMYFIIPDLDSCKLKSSYYHFRNLLDFINFYRDNLSSYIKRVSYPSSISKDYLLSNTLEELKTSSEDVIKFDDKIYLPAKIEKGKISKELLVIKDDKLNENLMIGTHLHEILQTINLKTKDLSRVNLSDKEVSILTKVLNLSCFNDLSDAKIYQELEFIFEDEGKNYHGIIDLLIEYDDRFAIIDYKLYNTDKEEYKRQLGVYHKYLSLISDKKIEMYLLSLIKAELKEVVLWI